MRIFIYQIRLHYKVYKDSTDNLLFKGHWFSTWKKGLQLELLDTSDKLILTVQNKIKKFFYWAWNEKYILTSIQDDIQGEIYCVKYLKRHWQMTFDNSIYDLYEHQGHLKTIFKDNIQIAKVNKQKFHYFERDTFYIDCNSDQNPLILCGLILAFDMGQDNEGATVSFNFGYINGLQEKKIDTSWYPK